MLLPYFLWAYEHEAALQVAGSTVDIASSDGTQQGDPLGPFLFSLVVDKVIQQIDSECNLRLNDWYLDDGNLCGEPSEVKKALDIIRGSTGLGLHMNNKTEIIFAKEAQRDEVMLRFGVGSGKFFSLERTGGLDVLGSPIGSVEYCEAYFYKHVVGKCETVCDELINLGNPHAAFFLLKSCISFCRAVFLMRTVPSTHIRQGLRNFDRLVMETLAGIIGFVGEASCYDQVSLATKRGGLGLRSAEHHAEAAYCTSIEACASKDEWSVAAAVNFEQCCREALRKMNLEQWTPMRQYEASAIIDDRQLENLLARSSPAEKARLLSLSSPGALAWLNQPPSSHNDTMMTPQEFRTAIHGILNTTPLQPHCGRCGEQYTGAQWGEHFSHSNGQCRKGGAKTRKHHAIRDCLVDLCHLGNLPVQKEVSCLGDGKRPGDVFIQIPHASIVIDVAVTNPQQPKYRQHASERRGYAGEHYAKTIKEDRMAAEVEAQGTFTFKPFVLETFGNMTQKSESIVQLIANAISSSSSVHKSISTNMCRQRISFTLWRANARSVIERTIHGHWERNPFPTSAAPAMNPADIPTDIPTSQQSQHQSGPQSQQQLPRGVGHCEAVRFEERDESGVDGS